MGVDVTHIVRHNFKEYNDMQACKKFVINTAYKLKTQLHDEVCVRRNDVNWKEIDELGWEPTLTHGPDEKYPDMPKEFSIRLNRYDVELILRNGFWQIESYFHYSQFFSLYKGHFYLRDMISDIARVLGEKEMWHAEEYYTWNGGCEMEYVSFEDWLEYAKSTEQGITEFDEAYWLAHPNEWPMPPIFHDDLSGLNERFALLQSQWPEFQLIGLLCNDELKYVVSKDGKDYWLNVQDGHLAEYNPADYNNIDWHCDVENYVTGD